MSRLQPDWSVHAGWWVVQLRLIMTGNRRLHWSRTPLGLMATDGNKGLARALFFPPTPLFFFFYSLPPNLFLVFLFLLLLFHLSFSYVTRPSPIPLVHLFYPFLFLLSFFNTSHPSPIPPFFLFHLLYFLLPLSRGAFNPTYNTYSTFFTSFHLLSFPVSPYDFLLLPLQLLYFYLFYTLLNSLLLSETRQQIALNAT